MENRDERPCSHTLYIRNKTPLCEIDNSSQIKLNPNDCRSSPCNCQTAFLTLKSESLLLVNSKLLQLIERDLPESLLIRRIQENLGDNLIALRVVLARIERFSPPIR